MRNLVFRNLYQHVLLQRSKLLKETEPEEARLICEVKKEIEKLNEKFYFFNFFFNNINKLIFCKQN